MNATQMISTPPLETARNNMFSTTVELNQTGIGHAGDIPASGGAGNGGDGGGNPRLRPSQWPTAAVLGGVVLLALVGVAVVLVYRKRRQRDYQRRAKRSEEEIGFMDAEAENRRSDIALQLLQVTDPSYFEIEEAAQNAKLQELQGQNDLSILEIIQVAEPSENDIQERDQTNTKDDSGQRNSTSTPKDPGEGTRISKESAPRVSVTENKDKVKCEQKAVRTSNVSVTSQKEIKDTAMTPSSTTNVAGQNTATRSSTTSVENNTSKDCKTERVTSTRLSSSIRNSKTEEGNKINIATENGSKRESKAANENKGNRTSLESRVEERIRQRQSARSSGHSTDRGASEKGNHNQSIQHPVNGVALVTDVARPSSSAGSSKHSSVNYEETIKQLKHIDSDPNITVQ